MKKLLLAVLATALIVPARADYAIRDGNGNPLSINAGTLNDGAVQTYSTPADSAGAPYSAANPLPIRPAGSTGTDTSSGGPAVPADVTFVLLATVPVNAGRALVGVQNQGAINLQVVRDDGAGANQTSLFVPGPFGVWTSTTFKGRIRVYGPSGTPVAAYQD